MLFWLAEGLRHQKMYPWLPQPKRARTVSRVAIGEQGLRFRARDVHVRYVVQTRCPSDFAIVSVDFEPLPDGVFGYEFVSELPDNDATRALDAMGKKGLDACLAALSEGIHQGLLQESGRSPLAVRAVLHHATFHPVDSAPRSFREAGRRAARAAGQRTRHTTRQDTDTSTSR